KAATAPLVVVSVFMRRSAWTKDIAILLLLGCVREATADVIYQTSFENPPFTTGALAGQDGWSVFGVSAAVSVQNSVAKTGTQAVLVKAAAVGSQQTGRQHGPRCSLC